MELLVVMALISILSTLGYMGSLKNIQKQKLQEAGAQLLSDLTTARSQAIRTTTNSSVTLTSTASGSPQTTYTTTWVAPGATSATTQTVTLQNGVKAEPYAGTVTYPNTITYTAPYAESDAISGVVWKLTNPASGAVMYLKMIGQTGKAVLSDQP